MKSFLKAIFTETRLYLALTAVIVLLVLGYMLPFFFIVGKIALVIVLVAGLSDVLLLFSRKGVFARRDTMDKLSNGDENEIQIVLENFYTFQVKLIVIDELPFQFQKRDQDFRLKVKANAKKILKYNLRPVERGDYEFGAVNVMAKTALGLFSRRYKFSGNMKVPVYPSYLQMRKYELLAISNRLTEFGIKKIRKIGHNLEFEQIREYVQGDDYRTINWKATARKRKLMVNQYQDERSQRVYSVINMGRVMKMPFEGLTLLEYAINSSLVISNIAIRKHDKAGIMTFSDKVQGRVKASGKSTQMNNILEMLYNQKTDFSESSYESLYANIKYKLNQRSLILLYTNFETLNSLKRQMKYLRSIAASHLLVVVFFENTELKKFLDHQPEDTEEVYKQTIAEKFDFEKRQTVKELAKYGIHSILTAPENLTVDSINKYLELKARGLI